MSDGQYFGFGILLVILSFCGLVIWITHEVRRGPGKRGNTRLPPPSRACNRGNDAGWWS